jgi:hypothetical protein
MLVEPISGVDDICRHFESLARKLLDFESESAECGLYNIL